MNGSISQRGFTLIELILVIMLLGIVSVSVSGILRSVMTAVVSANEREDLVRQGSYLLERFDRELSLAVPNSVRISGNAAVQCVEFVPLVWSGVYLTLPLQVNNATQINLLELGDIYGNSFAPSDSDYAIVFPTRASEVYDASVGHRRSIESCSDDGDGNCATLDDADKVVQVKVENGFAQTSPSKKIYFANHAVSYCMRQGAIYRHQTTINTNQTLHTSGGALMAQNLVNQLSTDPQGAQNPFRQFGASAQGNAITRAMLIFGREDERIGFVREVQIPNVP